MPNELDADDALHNPLSNPQRRHPRAKELLPHEEFFNVESDLAPFGSDEGWEAYQEWREWRAQNPHANLIECISWILKGRVDLYTERLLAHDRIAKVAADCWAEEPGLEGWDAFTLDATIMATALGQLLDEGRIHPEAKPFARVAVERQSHSKILAGFGEHAAERQRFLAEVKRAIEMA